MQMYHTTSIYVVLSVRNYIHLCQILNILKYTVKKARTKPIKPILMFLPLPKN